MLARILRISPRQLQRRLACLKARGQIEITRRSRLPAAIALVLLPDCILDATSSVVSKADFDETSSVTSKKEPDATSRVTSETASDVTSQGLPIGHCQKNGDLKSDSCEPYNRGITGEIGGAADFHAHPTAPSSSNDAHESRGNIFRHAYGAARPYEGAPDDGDAINTALLDAGPSRDDMPAYDLAPFVSVTTRPKAALTCEVALDYGVDPERGSRRHDAPDDL